MIGHERPLRRARPRRLARHGLLACVLIAASSCHGDAVGPPPPESLEPEPFPNPRSVRLWIYATGLALERGESFQQGFTVDEPSVSFERYRYPSAWLDSVPSAYRIAWWSSDPEVLAVSSTGR